MAKNFIKFLGTAGARHVVSQQLRSSAGIWLQYNNTKILIDPGPGTLVRIYKSKPRLDPTKLDAIILTHRHIDHSCDVNVMIEAMTQGGNNKKGKLFLPSDALNNEPVVFRYAQNYVQKIHTLMAKGQYQIGSIKFETPVQHRHGVETYGLKMHLGNISISFIADTAYFPEIPYIYNTDIIIINVVRYYSTGPGQFVHLCLEDVKKILSQAKPTPKLCLLTHFGLTMLHNNPETIAKRLSKDLGTKVISAKDGILLQLG